MTFLRKKYLLILFVFYLYGCKGNFHTINKITVENDEYFNIEFCNTSKRKATKFLSLSSLVSEDSILSRNSYTVKNDTLAIQAIQGSNKIPDNKDITIRDNGRTSIVGYQIVLNPSTCINEKIMLRNVKVENIKYVEIKYDEYTVNGMISKN